MDTSDSEYFESADEDFQSDEETTTIVNASTKNDIDQNAKLKDATISLNTAEEVKCADEIVRKDEGGHNTSQAPKIEKLQKLSEKSLISRVENLNIEKPNSKSQQHEAANLHVEEISESLSQTQDEIRENRISEELKESKINNQISTQQDTRILENSEIVNLKKTETIEKSLNEELKETRIENKRSSSEQHETKELGIEEKLLTESQKQNETVDKSVGKEIKKSKIKSKLGSKAPIKLTQFEASPKKIVESTEREEVKNVVFEKIEESKAVEEENLWENDELDWGAEAEIDNKSNSQSDYPVTNTNKNPEQEKWNNDSDGWSSWSNWGASVLSTATQSVSTITTQLTNVIETGLGAVDPEELARLEREERKKSRSDLVEGRREQLEDNSPSEGSYGGFGLGNFVKLVENTGTKVLNGGLDTLETIGKKTMEVLQEGDPGLKKKKAFLKINQDKPVLSQILREAKEKAENEYRTSEVTSIKKRKNYETLFDDHHGLVHLEALELLSKQCDIKLKSIQSSMSGDEYTDFSETMDQIKELCELPDEEDEEISVDEIKKKLESAVTEMKIPISYEKLLTNWDETEVWLSTLNLEICDEDEIHQQAIETLAEMTSRAMEQFHKTGELLLVKERRKTAEEADNLVQITSSLISLMEIVASKFSEKLKGKSLKNKDVSGLMANVFFEAANSSSYIQSALQLLIPVLQVGAI